MAREGITQAFVTLDHTGFSYACPSGYRNFNLAPPVVRVHKNHIPDSGPLRIAKTVGATQFSIHVSAPGGKFAQNVMMIYNACWGEYDKEITTPSVNGPITNVQVSHSRLVAFTLNRIFIFVYPAPCKQIKSEEIRPNPTGISAISYDATTNTCFLAFPGYNQGSVNILDMHSVGARESKSPVSIDAHKSEITQVALNNLGTLLATGSKIGTVIRVFDVRSKARLYELRRGTSAAHLKCLAFSPCSSYLGVASDKTIHVFGIREAEPANQNVLERNMGMGSLFHIPINREVLAIGFSKPLETTKTLRSVIAICSDGTYWQYTFEKDTQSSKVHYSLKTYDILQENYDTATFILTPP